MRSLAALAAVLALLIAGCGVQKKSKSKFSGTKADVASTVSSLGKEAGKNDTTKICNTLLSKALAASFKGKGCVDTIGDAIDDADARSLDVKAVTVNSPTTATATVKTTGAGKQNISATLRLVRERGTWRIDSFG